MERGSPVDELRKDHQAILTDARDLEATVRGLGTNRSQAQDAVSGSLRTRVEMLRDGMHAHFRREEDGLFPEAQRLVAETEGRVWSEPL